MKPAQPTFYNQLHSCQSHHTLQRVLAAMVPGCVLYLRPNSRVGRWAATQLLERVQPRSRSVIADLEAAVMSQDEAEGH